jgi:hypothetical protein
VTVDEAVEQYAEILVDTDALRDALRTIFESTLRDDDVDELPDEVSRAYQTLRSEVGLDEPDDDEVGPPAPWSPADVYAQARIETTENPTLLGPDADVDGPGLLGGGFLAKLRDGILSPLRQLSFWTMKARARRFGENGAAKLLRQLQKAAPKGAHFHLMGHSFGCLVVTAALAGKRGGPKAKPVDSLLLVQGALSLWAYAETVPDEDEPGYFARVIGDGLVRGPIVTTRSSFDYAVGRFYPLGAGIAGSVLLGDELPRFGGLGAFGICGVEEAEDVEIGDRDTDYGFVPGHVYNVDASSVIRKLEGPGGAHNDIAYPETARLAWQAALATD